MSSRNSQLSYSDLLQLAQSPGPLQGMAQALLTQHWSDDDRVNATGAMHSRKFDEADYGDALMRNLVGQYGEQVVPPSSAEPTQEDMHQVQPSNAAIEKWQDHMDHYYPEPGIWDKIKAMSGAVAEHPMDAVRGLGDIASYGAPFIANMRGVNDFKSDYDSLVNSVADDSSSGRSARGTAPDGFDRMLAYGPALGMDVAQSLIPIGFSGMGKRTPEVYRNLMAKYGQR